MKTIIVICLKIITLPSNITFQSLDETTQHALTACVASFIYTKVVDHFK